MRNWGVFLSLMLFSCVSTQQNRIAEIPQGAFSIDGFHNKERQGALIALDLKDQVLYIRYSAEFVNPSTEYTVVVNPFNGMLPFEIPDEIRFFGEEGELGATGRIELFQGDKLVWVIGDNLSTGSLITPGITVHSILSDTSILLEIDLEEVEIRIGEPQQIEFSNQEFYLYVLNISSENRQQSDIADTPPVNCDVLLYSMP